MCVCVCVCVCVHSMQAFSHEVMAKQPEYDRVRAEGQHLLQLVHPRAVGVLQTHLHDLERAWLDLRGRDGERDRGEEKTA